MILQTQPDTLNSFKIFKATAQPAFLIADFLNKFELQASTQVIT
jgi:hypothetical protein